MSEFKGTKGEWNLIKNSAYFEVSTDLWGNGKGLTVGVFFQRIENGKLENDSHCEESHANAKLISCAPEMLEMLKKVLEENHCTPDLDKEIEQLIQKATTL